MLWALADPSALPAKRFAEYNPAPALDWLQAFSEDRFRHDDLVRFGVAADREIDKKLAFSLIKRPAPYSLSPRMSLIQGFRSTVIWDQVMAQIARWLLRHLDDPELILWLAAQGGKLHEHFANQLGQRLSEIADYEGKGQTAELDKLKADSPAAIPRPLLRVLWRLYLAGNIKTQWADPDLYLWKRMVKRDGLTASTRLHFRRLLAPKVRLKQPFRWPSGDDSTIEESARRPVDWDLELAADHVHSTLQEFRTDSVWIDYLPFLFRDIEQLLLDVLDISAELGEADAKEDRSSWHMPSIKPHWQNRGFEDWTSLVELLRDAWLGIEREDPSRAKDIARSWFGFRYPTFKRLSLFAASRPKIVPGGVWVDWLANDDWWLWSIHTKREVMRLLVERGAVLSMRDAARLENAILRGPPRDMYKSDVDPDEWQSIVDRAVWLRLAKLRSARSELRPRAERRFGKLSAEHPDWELEENERDEFWHWMSGTGDPDYEDRREVDVAPNSRQSLVEWLSRPPVSRGPFYEDTWSDRCRTRFYLTFAALCTLSRQGTWPAERWTAALHAWGDATQAERSWKFATQLLLRMPQDVFAEVATATAWWLDAISRTVVADQEPLIFLSNRILAVDWEAADDEASVFNAINHPVGLVTQVLLRHWFTEKPNDDEGLPDDLDLIFGRLANPSMERLHHGRVVLASRSVSLFRVDQSWFTENLKPHFSWSADENVALPIWQGFLWSPRLHWPLLRAIKQDLLDTASHYAELGDGGRQFASFLTLAALERPEDFDPQEFCDAISNFPEEGLQEVARTLVQALESAGSQRAQYWENRIHPFWKNVWPKTRERASQEISDVLARLAIAADDAFPSALTAVGDWLHPVEYSHYVLHHLEQSGLVQRFPVEVLNLMVLVVDEASWPSKELRVILNAIIEAKPSLSGNQHVRRFDDYLRRNNM